MEGEKKNGKENGESKGRVLCGRVRKARQLC